jgi:purine-binding chemotaxis protein CheW
MDLRGNTTSIFNPRTYFDVVDGPDGGDRILILDTEDANIGWLVDGVDKVIEYYLDEVESSVSGGAVKGVIKRDEDFIIVVDPETIEETAET